MNVTELATALMRCPSVTPTTAGVYDVMEQFLVPLGFVAHRKSFGECEHAVENLYLRLGTQSPNFCFAGHTDVVPVGDASQWRVPAFEPQVIDGELYGRGAEDMKGAIAAFMIAVREFVGTKFEGSISLLITQDEEGIAVHGTKPMLAWLTEQGEKIDACIVGEPTNPEVLGEMAKVGRRGSVSFVLAVAGVQGHVAYPERADSPVTRIIHMLHALKTETLDDGTDFFPPSNLEVTTIDVGNPTVNMIPAKASAQFNVRFNDLHTSDSVEAWVRERVARYGEYTLTKRVTGESFITHDARLVNIVTDAVRDVTGRTPAMSTTGGTSDARFIKNYCPVIEFGTTGRTAHMVNERVEVKTLEGLAKIYQRMLVGYFRL
jgi:succinyl-diaminopimelate desuccinylase